MDQESKLIRLALFGSPVKHSLSPRIHALFARQSGLEIEYSEIESSEDFLARDAQRLAQSEGRGCNITLPLKHQAYQLANRTSERARRARAVNTLVFRSDSIACRRAAVRAGWGIGAFPLWMAAQERNWQSVFVTDETIDLEVWLVARPEVRDSDQLYALFSRLGEALSTKLLDCFERVVFSTDSVILEKGQEGNGLFVIVGLLLLGLLGKIILPLVLLAVDMLPASGVVKELFLV